MTHANRPALSRATACRSRRCLPTRWAVTSSCCRIAGESGSIPVAEAWLTARSYGLSTGRPCEKGLVIDAQTALDFLLDHRDSRDGKMFVYGQSLGGALAIQLASKNQGKVDGLVLENTFRSMRTLIPSAFPPAKYLARLCHQIWPSEATLPLIEHTPILFLSGLKDELVPCVFPASVCDAMR